jgi:hypothetical protein
MDIETLHTEYHDIPDPKDVNLSNIQLWQFDLDRMKASNAQAYADRIIAHAEMVRLTGLVFPLNSDVYAAIKKLRVPEPPNLDLKFGRLKRAVERHREKIEAEEAAANEKLARAGKRDAAIVSLKKLGYVLGEDFTRRNAIGFKQKVGDKPKEGFEPQKALSPLRKMSATNPTAY